MKAPAILFGLLLAATPAVADKADDYYRLGMAALRQNNPARAEAAFRQALKLRPSHAHARAQLGRLPAQAETLKQKRRASEFASIRLKTVNFNGVPLTEALDALKLMVKTASAEANGEDKAVIPNFVVKDPKGTIANREVTLRLTNIPAKAALDYMVEQVGAGVRYDKHAIVIEAGN